MNDNTGKIEFLPVCSKCRNVIYCSIECKPMHSMEVDGTGDILAIHKYDSIIPARCPICGCYFESIIIPQKLPFDNTPKLTHRGDYE
jgi:hypothetical protein